MTDKNTSSMGIKGDKAQESPSASLPKAGPTIGGVTPPDVPHTPGPWWVRARGVGGEVVDCFVAACDVNGFAYDAEILGDDEYREHTGGIARKLADCNLIAAAPALLSALEELTPPMPPPNAMCHVGICSQDKCCNCGRIKRAREAIAKARGQS
jgi:hypothetical protein